MSVACVDTIKMEFMMPVINAIEADAMPITPSHVRQMNCRHTVHRCVDVYVC